MRRIWIMLACLMLIPCAMADTLSPEEMLSAEDALPIEEAYAPQPPKNAAITNTNTL